MVVAVAAVTVATADVVVAEVGTADTKQQSTPAS